MAETYPQPDEENEEPTCQKCGFEGYVVACVWAGEEGCMLPTPAVLEATKQEDGNG